MFPQKQHAKIITDPLNGCGILQIGLRPLECILFQQSYYLSCALEISIFFKVMFTFFDFCTHKINKKLSPLSEKGVVSGKFFLPFAIHDRLFKKTVS